MTVQIKSAIDRIIDTRDYKYSHFGFTDNTGNAFDLAIRSLQAWDEVLNELKSAKVNNIPCDSAEEAIGIGKGLTYAIDIINQKLAEIEK